MKVNRLKKLITKLEPTDVTANISRGRYTCLIIIPLLVSDVIEDLRLRERKLQLITPKITKSA